MGGRVTAIVSAYYAEDYIKERLENLCKAGDIEVVVVAQFDSPEMHTAYDFRGRLNITVLVTENIPTIYKAWNMAIKGSTGDYITNANTDDLTYPDSYSDMANILDNNADIDMLYGDVRIKDSSDIMKFYGEGLKDMLKVCYGSPMPMWRKSVHGEIGYFNEDYEVAGDYEFWLRMLSHGFRLRHCGFIVGEYTKRPDSAEHRQPMKTLQETSRARTLYRK